MPRPRLAQVKASIQGSAVKNPQRFRERREPVVDGPLGNPPPWLIDDEDCMARTAWGVFQADIPWLNASHRSLVEIACQIRGRLIAGQGCSVQMLQLLRQCLGQMGATPADATKVTTPGDDKEDPEAEFFSRPN